MDGALSASFILGGFPARRQVNSFARVARSGISLYTSHRARRSCITHVVSRNWVTVSASDRFMRRSRSEATTGVFISALPPSWYSVIIRSVARLFHAIIRPLRLSWLIIINEMKNCLLPEIHQYQFPRNQRLLILQIFKSYFNVWKFIYFFIQLIL